MNTLKVTNFLDDQLENQSETLKELNRRIKAIQDEHNYQMEKQKDMQAIAAEVAELIGTFNKISTAEYTPANNPEYKADEIKEDAPKTEKNIEIEKTPKVRIDLKKQTSEIKEENSGLTSEIEEIAEAINGEDLPGIDEVKNEKKVKKPKLEINFKNIK